MQWCIVRAQSEYSARISSNIHDTAMMFSPLKAGHCSIFVFLFLSPSSPSPCGAPYSKEGGSPAVFSPPLCISIHTRGKGGTARDGSFFHGKKERKRENIRKTQAIGGCRDPRDPAALHGQNCFSLSRLISSPGGARKPAGASPGKHTPA